MKERCHEKLALDYVVGSTGPESLLFSETIRWCNCSAAGLSSVSRNGCVGSSGTSTAPPSSARGCLTAALDEKGRWLACFADIVEIAWAKP